MSVAVWMVFVLVAAGCASQILDRPAIPQESPTVKKETSAVTSSVTMQPKPMHKL
ncbi:MAG: hypothetical protein K0Q73_4224 [Paenibacillus sp.]|nr:hypothetical protein [Paenibacillus sp.]